MEKSADKLINLESDIEEIEEELMEKREKVEEQLLKFRLLKSSLMGEKYCKKIEQFL